MICPKGYKEIVFPDGYKACVIDFDGIPNYWELRGEMIQALEDIYYPQKENEIEYHI